MIDPINMTRYGQTKNELEETLLFACCVAGKNAVTTAKVLDKFLLAVHDTIHLTWGDNRKYRPFKTLRDFYEIYGEKRVASLLAASGIGCYNHRARTFWELIDSGLNLKTCTTQDLENIWGIAEKTSRFFLLHTRADVRYAALDRHILSHMRSLGCEFPKGQPSGKRYLKLEQDFLNLADESGLTVAEFDLNLWRKYSQR